MHCLASIPFYSQYSPFITLFHAAFCTETYKTSLARQRLLTRKPTKPQNKTNGIVEQNQWNCSTKSIEWLNKTNGFVSLRRQIDLLKLTD